MAKLKLCLMVHVEVGKAWRSDGSGIVPNAREIGAFASIVGGAPRGAKVSLQSDLTFLDANAAVPYPGGPTSLQWIYAHGGNFWCHTHSGNAAHLQSVHVAVGSAWAGEAGVAMSVATSAVAGRSGGPETSDPSLDWASIAVYRGILRANSAVVNYYATMAETMRPYGMSYTDALGKAYFHDAAPGPLDNTMPTTMRQRPFWVQVASTWDAGLTCIYPSTLLVSSILMIPHPSRGNLAEYAGGRDATSEPYQLTMDDFKAAMTEIWTTWSLMDAYQNSITNVWYAHIPPSLITTTNLLTFGYWVDSINAMMGIGGGSPKAEWKNMNEIASMFANPDSFHC